MARRRMFSLNIVDTDEFLDMPTSAQSLYFHLGMRADDDGFVSNPKKIIKVCNTELDDLNLLIAKKFIHLFENGIVIILDWKENNYIQKDRYTKTKYIEELARMVAENNRYIITDTICIQNGYESDTQDRLGKDRKGKSKDKIKETFVSVIDSYTDNPELIESLKNYVDMRKKMRGFTVKALQLNLKELDNLAVNDSMKIEIVNQSISRSWKGLFPIKIEKKEEIKKELAF